MPVAPWWEEFSSSAPTDAPAEGAPAAATPAEEPARDTLQVRRTPRRRPRDLLALQVSAAALAVVLLALLGVLAVRDRPVTTAGPATSSAAVAGAVTPPAGRPSASTAATDDAAAVRELEELRARGIAEHPPTGQWAAQLAAKSIGTTDPAQVAANGSHTFYAGDILAQSRGIAAGPAGADVFVLRSDDFGKGSVDARGNPYWTTLAAGPFASAADVQAWCDSVFGSVAAATRGNVCLPRQLLPPA